MDQTRALLQIARELIEQQAKNELTMENANG
jgi:hypothetical protein